MRKFVLALMLILGIGSCAKEQGIPYVVMQNYFFQNGATIPADARIDDSESFSALFGAAALMGEDGAPTAVDFAKEFVIAIVNPVTDRATELVPESLQKAEGELVFTYSEKVGERQTWSSQPVLLIKVDRSYDTGSLRVVRHLQEQACIPAEYTSIHPDNMQRVKDFLHKTGVYFLATQEGDQPRVRPFGTAEIIEGKLYIQTGHVKNVAKQIAVNPKVGICAYDGQTWLRIAATLVEDPRVEIKKAMLDANPGLRGMYDENDDNTAVYFLKDAVSTFSSFTSEPETILF